MSQKICIFAPANFYLIMNLFIKQISNAVIGAISIVALCTSCLGDSNDSEKIVNNFYSPLITSASLIDNSKVCTGLSSYRFTIDQYGTSDPELIEKCRSLWEVDEYTQKPGIIFNADSLPCGAIPDSIKVSLTYSAPKAVKFFQYDDQLKQQKVTNFADTQIVWFDDYAVTRIQITAQDGRVNKSYFMKVNVHKCTTDTIMWKYLAKDLFDMTEVIDQRVDTIGHNLYWYLTHADHSQQVRIADLCGDVSVWSDAQAVTSPAELDLGSLYNWRNALYAVGTEGMLMTSTDGINWSTASTDYTFVNILGAQLKSRYYDEHLCAIASIEGSYHFVRSNDGASWSKDSLVFEDDTTSVVPSNFPLKDYTRPISVAANTKKGGTTSRIYISGGIKADNTLTSSTWTTDGIQWAEMEQLQLPPMRRASIVRYTLDVDYPDSFWIMQTGEMENGQVSDTLYFSENSGVTWKRMTLDYYRFSDTYQIEPFGCSSAYFNPINYRIYFIGGKDNEGKQESNIVTGQLMDLAIKQKH